MKPFRPPVQLAAGNLLDVRHGSSVRRLDFPPAARVLGALHGHRELLGLTPRAERNKQPLLAHHSASTTITAAMNGSSIRTIRIGRFWPRRFECLATRGMNVPICHQAKAEHYLANSNS